MDIIEAKSSPTFKNLKCYKSKQSPLELKDKMRKSYKDRVHNCRNMLINRLRGVDIETDLRNTLKEIYKSISQFPNNHFVTDDEENELMEKIKNELVEEEFEWWINEYENSNIENVDWSLIEYEENVICPVCKKTNFVYDNGILSCSLCKYSVKIQNTLTHIKNTLITTVEKHNTSCNANAQFHVLSEICDTHLYLICDSCLEMQFVM